MCLSGAHPPTEVEANRFFLRAEPAHARITNAMPCSSDAQSSSCSGDTSLSGADAPALTHKQSIITNNGPIQK